MSWCNRMRVNSRGYAAGAMAAIADGSSGAAGPDRDAEP
jgi:hypothetical protein